MPRQQLNHTIVSQTGLPLWEVERMNIFDKLLLLGYRYSDHAEAESKPGHIPDVNRFVAGLRGRVGRR